MISLTDKAASKIKEMVKSENDEAMSLRLGVKGGGCSGFNYSLSFEKNISENDQVFSEKGITIVIDPQSYIYLSGTKLDFIDSLNGSGFTFSNPNAAKTCGCGSSFQA